MRDERNREDEVLLQIGPHKIYEGDLPEEKVKKFKIESLVRLYVVSMLSLGFSSIYCIDKAIEGQLNKALMGLAIATGSGMMLKETEKLRKKWVPKDTEKDKAEN